MGSRTLDYLPVADLPNDPVNPKGHVPEEIADSIARFGFNEPVVIDERTGLLLSGHGRKKALLAGQAAGGLLDPLNPAAPRAVPEGIEVDAEGRWLVPVVRGVRSENDDEASAMLVAFNHLTTKGGWTNEGRELAAILVSLDRGPGMAGTGMNAVDLAGLLSSLGPKDDAEADARDAERARQAQAVRSLQERFGAPPFSVLDGRQGYWKDRKRHWLDLGINSGEGRTQNTLAHSRQAEATGRVGRNGSMPTSYSAADPSFYAKKREVEELLGREIDTVEFTKMARDLLAPIATTSVFDPVLCELAYRWWAPPGGLVLDPFAGGSVRGIVAAWTGRRYLGVDLSTAQVAENEAQWRHVGPMAPQGAPRPEWHVGDSRDALTLTLLGHRPADFVFSCPPYFDLERYTDDPADLSNAGTYEEFRDTYRQIIVQACGLLAPDRFSCFVVGEVRTTAGGRSKNGGGGFVGLVADTIAAFRDGGCDFHNDAVFLTPLGSVPVRAASVFKPNRRLAKVHQNVLVFCKGDPGRAAAAVGAVEAVAEVEGALPPAHAPEAQGAPAWARGYPVARLAEVAALFAAHDGDLPMGAFSAVNESMVAAAADEGRLHALADEGGDLAAAFLARESKAASPVTDFRGDKPATIPAGAFAVSRLACRPGYEQALADAIAAEAAGRPLWVNVWQEHPAERAIADELGLACHAVKIKASSELVGVYGPPPAPALPDLDAAGLVRLDVEFDPAEAAAEIAAAGPAWESHYAASYNVRGTWTAVALRGFGGAPEAIHKPAEMSKQWQKDHPGEMAAACVDTPLWDALPACAALADLIPGPKERVRLMRLAPGGGELSRHADITDRDAGTADGRLMRIHFPIVSNPDVVFSSWRPDGRETPAVMEPGSVWYLDTRKPHTARNAGATERIHLVVDVAASPALRALASSPALPGPPPPPHPMGAARAARWEINRAS